MKMKIMSKGTICIPTLAIMRITFVLPLVPASDAIPTGKVIFDAVVIKIFGKKKPSPTDSIKEYEYELHPSTGEVVKKFKDGC